MNQLPYPSATKNQQPIKTRNKTNLGENTTISYQKGWELAFDLMEFFFEEKKGHK